MSGNFVSNRQGPRSRGVSDKLRRVIMKRDDRRCQIGGEHCVFTATEVDHIVPVFEGGGDERENLRAVCSPCHAVKTQEEAQRARARFSVKRPPPPHPAMSLMDPRKARKWAELLRG